MAVEIHLLLINSTRLVLLPCLGARAHSQQHVLDSHLFPIGGRACFLTPLLRSTRGRTQILAGENLGSGTNPQRSEEGFLRSILSERTRALLSFRAITAIVLAFHTH